MGKFSIIRGQKVKGLPELLELAGRELRFYGITFFQVGIGFLVSVRLTQRAADSVPPREDGDITPDDVREKMARVAKPRRR